MPPALPRKRRKKSLTLSWDRNSSSNPLRFGGGGRGGGGGSRRRKTKDVVHQLPVRPCPSQLPDALSHEHSLDHAGVKESIRRSFREASIFLIDELEGLSTRS